MQQEPEQDQGRALETEREAAKDFLRPYVVGGWTLKEVSAKPLEADRPEYTAHTGPSEVHDEADEPHAIKRGQLAVTRVQGGPCFAVYDIAYLMAEIRDEARGYRQQTLTAIFAQEQERIAQAERKDEELWRAIAPVQQKRPAVFRSYNAGRCQNPDCGEYLGYIEAEGGRDRHYCNDKCRVAAHRKRKREESRQQVL